MNCDLIAVFASDLRACERTQRCFTLIHIGHLHIFHNTACLPPQNIAEAFSSISLGTTAIPRRNKKRRLCQVLGVNKVYYGRCANGQYESG